MTFDIYKGSFDIPNANKSSLAANSKASMDQIPKDQSRSRSPIVDGEKDLESFDNHMIMEPRNDTKPDA